MQRGGKRSGAGRKKGFSAIGAEEARKLIVQQVSGRLEPIIAALIRKAEKGDIRAAQILLDRAYGRASQETDVKKTMEFEPITSITMHVPCEHRDCSTNQSR